MRKTDETSKMITITEIQTITDYCMKLLNWTDELSRDAATEDAYTLTENIFKSLRKLFVATIMHDRKLICISGLQGVGKTTLMKSFYGLDEKFFNISLDRGERIPVLITEREVSQPIMHEIKLVKSIDGQYSQQTLELDIEDFIKATRGEDIQTMYLELIVPYTHTYNNGVSFMLLPGFEKEKTYWNNLIEFSVNSSDAAVFVFNETSFSHADNDMYLRKIESKFGENIIYAITGSDGSLDGNAETKETCMKVLNIPESEQDRVVCTGLFSDETKNNDWIQKFKRTLEKYAYSEAQQFCRNSEYIYDEIEDIEENLKRIRKILNDDDSTEIKSYHNDKLLKIFDEVVHKKREEFKENIDDEFEKAKNKSVELLEKQFDEQPKVKGLKRIFFGSSVKEQFTKTREMVNSSLKEENLNLYIPDEYLGNAFKRTIISLDTPKQKTDFSKILKTKKDDDKTLLLVDDKKTKAAVSDICTLLVDISENEKNYELLSVAPKRVVGAVVEMATYYYSLKCYDFIAENTGLPYYEPAQTNLIGDDIVHGAESSKKFVAGIAGIMGIDLIGDGSINLVTQIGTSLGVAAPVAGTLAILMTGAGAASVLLKDLNRMQREDFQSARFAVNGVYDNLKEASLKRYDIYMARIRERIEDNLTALGGEQGKIIAIYNAKVEVNNALNSLKEIKKRSMGEKYGLVANLS